ncbi:hypothetical protein [Xenorhabdus ehlersii]|uniref:Uncharacterized protein n=1 Tax=Xenorhabdus ehlersii TaxID=290111 RepID=A0A2D0IMI7_9GAMM|nr:hypothetical protein [Xenorhabdus ehlersii]PHM23007.1 hypothetical protein Xehl_03241 [Xenorhabdus ehlersii]RKE92674.1 hypothetical protein BDE27_0331 [Xenorhabdus ehlersii]
MNERQFKTYLAAAESIGGDYFIGYQRGLRSYFHNNTPVESTQKNANPDMETGYRDGMAGNPPQGFHGNIGNLNAAGVLPADSMLTIRLNSQLKSRYVKQAQREGMKLSAWALKYLNAASED